MKTFLFATTALFSIATLATAGPLPARGITPPDHAIDANQRFLCTYGFRIYTKASYTTDSHESTVQFWARAGIPVIGKGTAINEIAVANAPSSDPGIKPSGFSVGIYSGYRPYHHNLLVSEYVAPVQSCGIVRVSIPMIRLEKGKKYWIVEKARAPALGRGSSSAENAMIWLYDKGRTRGAVQQSGYSGCEFHSCYGHRSKWSGIAGVRPYARVRYVNGK